MAKVLMVQGTMSNAGKSLLVAGLCRIFKQDGFRPAPFKSQNMALNSFVTSDGLEMGRAQVMQAEAAGCRPDVAMNPILLKPTDNEGSQVIVNGVSIGNMRAKDYFAFKTSLIPDIKKAFKKLENEFDIIVIEGAGSPAEINLKENDIVNMGMAEMADAPVLLVGDIDRGGVFAQLLGTIMLLEDNERARIKGLIINKFRGDAGLLDPGIDMLEEMSGVPVVGVVPYSDIKVEDEDSLSVRFDRSDKGILDIVAVRFPRISNFTDLDIFEQVEGVSVRYVNHASDIGEPDMIVLPGSKNTVSDLIWMKESGIADIVKKKAAEGMPIFGICGGYQMLGTTVSDPEAMEGGGETEGLSLLPVTTVLQNKKTTKQYAGVFQKVSGIFSGLTNTEIEGYEIHMGHTEPIDKDCGLNDMTSGDTGFCTGNVYGTYIHGVFDRKEIVEEIIKSLAERKGVEVDASVVLDHRQFKESQYDKLADILREHLDMDAIYGMLGEAKITMEDE